MQKVDLTLQFFLHETGFTHAVLGLFQFRVKICDGLLDLLEFLFQFLFFFLGLCKVLGCDLIFFIQRCQSPVDVLHLKKEAVYIHAL